MQKYNKELTMTATTQNLQHTLLSSAVGQSVLDAIVQANVDMNTVSQAAVESMMQTERRRRIELGWLAADSPYTVCG